jgi:hypothetical protein
MPATSPAADAGMEWLQLGRLQNSEIWVRDVVLPCPESWGDTVLGASLSSTAVYMCSKALVHPRIGQLCVTYGIQKDTLRPHRHISSSPRSVVVVPRKCRVFGRGYAGRLCRLRPAAKSCWTKIPTVLYVARVDTYCTIGVSGG